jgi:hypothetical protein
LMFIILCFTYTQIAKEIVAPIWELSCVFFNMINV